MQRLVDQQPRKSAAIDEDIRGDGLALPGRDRRDRAVLVEVGVRDVRGLVTHAALQCFLVQKLPEQHRIEVVAVPDIERKMLGRFRREMPAREPRRDEEPIGMRGHDRRR